MGADLPLRLGRLSFARIGEEWLVNRGDRAAQVYGIRGREVSLFARDFPRDGRMIDQVVNIEIFERGRGGRRSYRYLGAVPRHSTNTWKRQDFRNMNFVVPTIELLLHIRRRRVVHRNQFVG